MLLAGVLARLTILTRANAMVLLLPLGLAVWTVRPRFSPRALAAPALLVVVALVTVSPWTIRNAIVLDRFIPVSTQLGSALAGTYNDQARLDKENPASWRAIRHLPEYRALYRRSRRSRSPWSRTILRARSKALHPRAPDLRRRGGAVDTLRDVRARRAGLVAPHRIDDQRDPRLGRTPACICFWVFTLLALAGAFDAARARDARSSSG